MVNYSVKNTYEILNSRGDLITSIPERTRDTTSTSLVLHGRGWSPYGLKRNENIVRLVENFAGSTPPVTPIAGQLWWKSTVTEQALYVYEPESGSPSWRTAVPEGAGIGFNITAGDGMDRTYDPFPSGSPLTVTPAIGAGRGFTFISGGLAVQESEIQHDNLVGFVANEHLDHSNINLQAGDGFADPGNGSPNNPTTITYPGGTLEFNVGAGRGISVTSSTGIDPNVVWLSTSGSQSVTGIKQFSGTMRANYLGTATNPSYAFKNDTNTGVYYQNSRQNEISFSTGGVQRFRMESGGVLRAIPSNYETLISDDADIPNKAYVDGVLSGSSNPTADTYVGTSSLSGLEPNCTYLVHVYGRTTTKGTGTATLERIALRRGSTTPGSGTLVDDTPSSSINWPDGASVTSATFIADISSDTSFNGRTEDSGSARAATYMFATRLSDPPDLGSPIPSSGNPELDDVDGSLSPFGSVFYPSAYTALAQINFGTVGSYPYTTDHTVVSEAGGSTAAFLSFSQIGNDWLPGGGTPSDFEIRATSLGTTGTGTFSGVVGAWVALGVTRSWQVSKPGSSIGLATWTIQFEIRQITNPANTTGPVTYTLRAESII